VIDYDIPKPIVIHHNYHMAIYSYMTDLRITQSRYNLPDVSQGFSNNKSDHDVLQQFHHFTLYYVHISVTW
jgi:hypothetical protein